MARRLREVLAGPHAPATNDPPTVTPANVAGDWTVVIRYVLGESRHAMSLTQEGATLTGRYCSQYEAAPLAGQVAGDRVRWAVTLGYESNRARYAFSGQMRDGVISGEVELGEYGHAHWEARPTTH